MEVDIKALCARYLHLRSERSKLKAAYEAADKGLEEEMDKISETFIARLKDNNLTSMRTDYGTIILSARTRYWSSDWGEMYKFMKEHDALDLMERRIHAGNMASFLETHRGVVPPGLNIDSKTSATVRAN